MANPLLRDAARVSAQQQELLGRLVLREADPPAANAVAQASGLTGTCLKTTARNNAGRTLHGRHWAWIEDVVKSVDPTECLCDEGIQVLETQTHAFLTDTTPPQSHTFTLSAPIADDDLLVLYGGGEFDDAFAAVLDASPTARFMWRDSLSEGGLSYSGGVVARCVWGSDVAAASPDRVSVPVKWDSTVTGAGRLHLLFVLRGVRRRPASEEGTYITGVAGQSGAAVLNGMPSYYYRVDDTGHLDPRVELRDTASPINLQNVDHLGLGLQVFEDIEENDQSDDAQDLTHVFPAGTQWLVLRASRTGNNSAEPAYPPSLEISPPEGLIGEVRDTVDYAYATSVAISAHLLGPDATAGAFSEQRWRDWFAPYDEINSLGGRDYLHVLPLEGAEEPPPAEATCDKLVVGDLTRTASLTADTAAARAEAKRRIAAQARRHPVLVQSPIAAGDEGTVIWGGYVLAPVYLRHPDHRRAGPFPVNATREEVFEEPVGEVAGLLGRYYRSAAAARSAEGLAEPRLASIQGRSDVLCSGPSGPVKILRVYRDATLDPCHCSPWLYVDPVDGGEGVYGPWPEAPPDPYGVLPAGTELALPANYDPYLGRVRGASATHAERDRVGGPQLCLVYLPLPEGGDGGCC